MFFHQSGPVASPFLLVGPKEEGKTRQSIGASVLVASACARASVLTGEPFVVGLAGARRS